MKYYIFNLALILFAIINTIPMFSQKCKDYLIFDGSEEIVAYGLDTTGVWWLKTRPFAGEVRYIVNEYETRTFKEVTPLAISYDGEAWVFFGRDHINWYLVTPDTSMSVFAERIIDYGFSKNSESIYYAIQNGNETEVLFSDKSLRITNFFGKIYPNWDGTQVAFVLKYGNQKSIVKSDGFQSEAFDDLIPVGFWHDNSFIYCARRGQLWQIFKDKKPITEEFSKIIEYNINLRGTSAAFLVTNTTGYGLALLISDDLNQVQFSREYESVSNLALHPTEPMIIFAAKQQTNNYIVYNGIEYPLGEFQAIPSFSFDGKEILYRYCNIECYLFVDGQRITLPPAVASSNFEIARKSQTTTIAFSNKINMVMLDYSNGVQYSGMMVDSSNNPIYDWRSGLYISLGLLGNKVYLLTCKP